LVCSQLPVCPPARFRLSCDTLTLAMAAARAMPSCPLISWACTPADSTLAMASARPVITLLVFFVILSPSAHDADDFTRAVVHRADLCSRS
jgi:hypothetical protein